MPPALDHLDVFNFSGVAAYWTADWSIFHFQLTTKAVEKQRCLRSLLNESPNRNAFPAAPLFSGLSRKTGNTPNKVPTLESTSMAIRVFPSPNVIDRQMSSLLEERPSQKKKGKDTTESLSSCFVGVYSIKTVNRARWDVIICIVALIVILFYLE